MHALSKVPQRLDGMLATVLRGHLKRRRTGKPQLSRRSHARAVGCLTETCEGCENYKVWINAAQALSELSTRAVLGKGVENFCCAWSCTVQTLRSIDVVDDFSQFQYRETLKSQLVKNLLSLASMATAEDALTLATALVEDAAFLCSTLQDEERRLGLNFLCQAAGSDEVKPTSEELIAAKQTQRCYENLDEMLSVAGKGESAEATVASHVCKDRAEKLLSLQ